MGSERVVDRVRHEALALTKMASGHLCLNLSETISWEAFPGYAGAVLLALGGEKSGSVDGPDMRVWEVMIEGCRLRLVFDDFPPMVSLESSDAAGDAVLRVIHARQSQS